MTTGTHTYIPEQITAIGGHDWKRRRTYLNDVASLLGMDVDYYRSGNVSSATLDGEDISNARATELLGTRVYLDHATGRLVVELPARCRVLSADEIEDRVRAAVNHKVSSL